MAEVRHGTAHGYVNKNCRCDKCREWSRLKARERRIKSAGGCVDTFREMVGTYGEEYSQFVPADIAVEVVKKLKDEWGIPLTEIAKQAECDYSLIHGFYHGRTRGNNGRLRWETAGRIYGAEGWFEAEREARHDGA